MKNVAGPGFRVETPGLHIQLTAYCTTRAQQLKTGHKNEMEESTGHLKVNMSIIYAHTVNATLFFCVSFYMKSLNVTRER